MNNEKECQPVPGGFANGWNEKDILLFNKNWRTHSWVRSDEGHCLTKYQCKKCGATYYEDSSD